MYTGALSACVSAHQKRHQIVCCHEGLLNAKSSLQPHFLLLEYTWRTRSELPLAWEDIRLSHPSSHGCTFFPSHAVNSITIKRMVWKKRFRDWAFQDPVNYPERHLTHAQRENNNGADDQYIYLPSPEGTSRVQLCRYFFKVSTEALGYWVQGRFKDPRLWRLTVKKLIVKTKTFITSTSALYSITF